MDFNGVGFYFDRCDVVQGAETFSVIKDGCFSNIVNARFKNGPQETGFSYDSFRFGSSVGHSGNSAIVCSIVICSRTECNIPTELSQDQVKIIMDT